MIVYSVLGLLLGYFGSLFQLSLSTSIILQWMVGIFMIGTAMNLLEAHPIFRYFVIQPPRFLTRMVRNQSKSSDLFGSAILGAFTIFIPCGTTQAMMALAVASGSPLVGAAILFTFVLGTSPLFFALGYLTAKLGGGLQKKFTKMAALAIILLALFNLNNALSLAGGGIVVEKLWQSSRVPQEKEAPVSSALITISDRGYIPNHLTVRTGSEVTLNLVNKGGGGCTQAFTVPRYGIQKIIPLGTSDTVTFTAPGKPTELAFMCSMGMYRGTIKVI